LFSRFKRKRRIRWHARRKPVQTIPRNIEQRTVHRYTDQYIEYIQLNKDKRSVEPKYSFNEKVQCTVIFNVGLLETMYNNV
jgi:hypothetical protein